MMEYNQQLKLQAYLDGELPEAEAREVANWLARDREAVALLTELRNTRQALAGFEAGFRVPESEDFYWSKIRREIERLEPVEAPVRPAIPWFKRLRGLLIPAAAAAVLAALVPLYGQRPFVVIDVALFEGLRERLQGLGPVRVDLIGVTSVLGDDASTWLDAPAAGLDEARDVRLRVALQHRDHASAQRLVHPVGLRYRNPPAQFAGNAKCPVRTAAVAAGKPACTKQCGALRVSRGIANGSLAQRQRSLRLAVVQRIGAAHPQRFRCEEAGNPRCEVCRSGARPVKPAAQRQRRIGQQAPGQSDPPQHLSPCPSFRTGSIRSRSIRNSGCRP